MTRPGIVTETTCLAGREECKAGVPTTTGATADGSVVGTDELGKTGKDDRGADNLDNGCATADLMADEHLMVASDELTAAPLVTAEEGKAGTLPSLGGEENREPTGGAKLPVCVAGSLGKAGTTFVLQGSPVEPRLGIDWTGLTLGFGGRSDGTIAGVHATVEQLATDMQDSLGDWDMNDAPGVAATGLALWEGMGTTALVALTVGTC